jgi:hypothetical protein
MKKLLLLGILFIHSISYAECDYIGDEILFDELSVEDQELMESACSDTETLYLLSHDDETLTILESSQLSSAPSEELQGPIKQYDPTRIKTLDPIRRIDIRKTEGSGAGGM